jgi:NAD(P)-dependent dehydrogenase (short-subunit alcohol dehydrogenase family)
VFAMTGKKIVIIGGSSGIGFGIAKLAQQAGNDLLLAGRNHQRLEQAAAQLTGGNVTIATVDAHDEPDLERFFSEIGPCDHLVSMVGNPMSGGFLDCSMEKLREVMDSKFIANVLIGRLGRACVRAGGSLTFTSAVGGRPHLASGAYVGSLAIDALIEGLAIELAPDIRVNGVAPTFTETGLWMKLAPEQLATIRQRFVDRIPLGRLAKIEEVASAYLYLMSNNFITGQRLAVDGGIRLQTAV